MNYKFKLEHHFSAAHQLTHAYSKECVASIHGHNWEVFVEVITDELKDNMIIDFKKVKDIINELDHKNLNEILDFEPTAENIAGYLYGKIKLALKKRYNTQDDNKFKISVEVQETPGSSITCTR